METSRAADRLTSRFIAGSTIEREVAVCQRLNADGYLATLDHLGESVTSLEEAEQSRDAYLTALWTRSRSSNHWTATVSVKLTQLGARFLWKKTCRANVECLVTRAKSIGCRVEIDMESSAYVDRTLALVSNLHARYGSVRAVIQAYLYRSESDVHDLCTAVDSHPAYARAPIANLSDVAFPRKKDVDANLCALDAVELFDHGGYPRRRDPRR